MGCAPSAAPIFIDSTSYLVVAIRAFSQACAVSSPPTGISLQRYLNNVSDAPANNFRFCSSKSAETIGALLA
jgi:hypothetical protein